MESVPNPDHSRQTRAETTEALTKAGFLDYLKLIPKV